MGHLYKRFSDEQVAFLFQVYTLGHMNREEVQEALDISRESFFIHWKE